MAKLSSDPNSATSQWFINLADNGGPPNNLDTVNGGFTVFGRVIRTGMTAADKIVMGPRFNFGSPFDSLPLVNYEPESRQGRESCSDSRDCADPAVHIHCLEQ
jgi:peptidyl-prolyl cis-trans isomerase A (cyclophilin A)